MMGNQDSACHNLLSIYIDTVSVLYRMPISRYFAVVSGATHFFRRCVVVAQNRGENISRIGEMLEPQTKVGKTSFFEG